MLPNGINVMLVLPHRIPLQNLRHDMHKKVELTHKLKSTLRLISHHQLGELVTYPLRRHETDQCRLLFDGTCGTLFNLKPERGRQSHRTHKTQCIFRETSLWVTHRTDDFFL